MHYQAREHVAHVTRTNTAFVAHTHTHTHTHAHTHTETNTAHVAGCTYGSNACLQTSQTNWRTIYHLQFHLDCRLPVLPKCMVWCANPRMARVAHFVQLFSTPSESTLNQWFGGGSCLLAIRTLFHLRERERERKREIERGGEREKVTNRTRETVSEWDFQVSGGDTSMVQCTPCLWHIQFTSTPSSYLLQVQNLGSCGRRLHHQLNLCRLSSRSLRPLSRAIPLFLFACHVSDVRCVGGCDGGGSG